MIFDLGEILCSFGAEADPASALGVGVGFEVVDRGVDFERDEFPIIETCTFEIAIANFKSEWGNEMKLGTGGGTRPGNVSSVGRNLRMNENNFGHELDSETAKAEHHFRGKFAYCC